MKPTLGVARISIAGREVKFLVIADDFPVPFDGVLGTEYFLNNEAIIDFENKIFLVHNQPISIFQKHKIISINENSQFSNMKIDEIKTFLPTVETVATLSGTPETFLLDTGSEANLIKKKLLTDCKISIDESRSVFLKGVGDNYTPTLGTIETTVFGVMATFHVVPDDFPIRENGLLGADYLDLADATLDFKNLILK